VYERTSVFEARKRVAGSNLVDMGRNAARDSRRVAGVNSKPGCDVVGGHGESLRGVAVGDAAGVELDTKLIDRFRVNPGTVPGLFRCSPAIRVGVSG